MANLAPISAKIDALVRRLASDSPAERQACVAALGHQLDKAGASFNDLADRLAAVSPEPPAERGKPLSRAECIAAVESILVAGNGYPNARELDFLETMRADLRQYAPSAKQAAWIGRLADRFGEPF